VKRINVPSPQTSTSQGKGGGSIVKRPVATSTGTRPVSEQVPTKATKPGGGR
jgi:hypothetical protein